MTKPSPIRPFTRWRRNLCRSVAISMPGGKWLFPTRRRLARLEHSCGGKSEDLLILLPGIGDLPGDFSAHGFVATAWESGLAADVVEVDSHLGYYLRRRLVDRLHTDIVRPARESGYERVWLVGISLGGLGALLYAQAHPEALSGVALLAPFVGFQQFIDGIVAAGGPRRWRAAAGGDFQHDLWHWLVSESSRPPIFLGFGEQDEFAPANRLLAELLPQENVFVTMGDHDWITWRRLWAAMLATGVFATERRQPIGRQ